MSAISDLKRRAKFGFEVSWCNWVHTVFVIVGHNPDMRISIQVYGYTRLYSPVNSYLLEYCFQLRTEISSSVSYCVTG